MGKLIIFITFFCCLPHTFSQVKYYIDDTKNILKTNPLEKYGPMWDPNENKGFIKDAGVTRSYDYWFILGGNKDVPLSLLDTGKPQLYVEKHYDTNGNVIKEIIKADDEDRVTNFFYNSKCQLTKYISNKDSTDEYESYLTYDSIGNVIQIDDFSKRNYRKKKTLYIYDTRNNLIEEKNYVDDTLNNITKYKYDKFGNNTEKKIIYFSKNDTDIVKYKIEYDDGNKILYRTGFKKSDKMFDEKYEYEEGSIYKIIEKSKRYGTIYEYNKDGFLISIYHKMKRSNGNEIFFNKNYYNKNNLITKILIRDSYNDYKSYEVNLYSYEYR